MDEKSKKNEKSKKKLLLDESPYPKLKLGNFKDPLKESLKKLDKQIQDLIK